MIVQLHTRLRRNPRMLARWLPTAVVLLTLGFISGCSDNAGGGGSEVPPSSAERAAAKGGSQVPPTSPERPAANPLRNPYFGDLHVHTARSLDAGLQGVVTTPADAYQYAKGEDHQLTGDRTVKIGRPLDFAAVTDHAEYFGNFSLCYDQETLQASGQPNPIYPLGEPYDPISCDYLRAEQGTPEANIVFALTFALSWLPEEGVILPSAGNAGYCFDDDLQAALGLDQGTNDDDDRGDDACWYESTNFWNEAQEAANAANEPGFFTAFKAYEWTGGALSANLHRNVIFGGDTVPERPYSYFEAPRRELLWAALNGEECLPEQDDPEKCQVLIIPHNSNLSQGRMFETVMPGPGRNDVPIDTDYATNLGDYERLVEIIQHKGQSECVTADGVLEGRLDPPELINRVSNDELCNFEIVNWATLAGELFDGTQKPQDFVRDALKVGMTLLEDETVGVNPFKYGIIGSTDTHQSAPGMVNEATHPGHGGGGALFEDGDGCDPDDPATCEPAQPSDEPKGLLDTPEYGPGGLAVIWAEENTREAIFAALQRKEVYGTSGTRPVVRFFGGFDLPEGLCNDPDAIQKAYDNGVPMGGDLGSGNGNPRFLLAALMDQGDTNATTEGGEVRSGTPLQRVQIIKGWIDSDGAMQEKVVHVAGDEDDPSLSDQDVDLETCAPLQPDAGSPSLCEVWEDDEFDAEQNAFYYGRVLEEPVCRWHTYQCNAKQVTPQVCEQIEAGNTPEGFEGFEKCCQYQYPPDNALAGLESQKTVELPKTIQERAWTTPIWYEVEQDGGRLPRGR
jgi:hypothetical protein